MKLLTLSILLAILSIVSSSCQNEIQWPFYGGNSAHTSFISQEIRDSHEPTLLFNTNIPNTKASLSYVTSCNGYIFAVAPLLYKLIILSTQDGSIVKTIDFDKQYSMSAPSCGNDRVYVNSVGSNEGLNVHHYEIGTWKEGKVIVSGSQWAHYNYGVVAQFPYKNNYVYVPGGYYNGQIVAFEPDSGEIKFTSSIAHTGFAADNWVPAIYKGRVFVNNGQGENTKGFIGEVDPNNGTMLWKVDVPSTDLYTTNFVPVIARFVYYFVNVQSNNTLEYSAVDINDPSYILWKFQCNAPSSHRSPSTVIDFSPSSDAFSCFFICEDGIHEVDGWDGHPLNLYECDDCYGKPIITSDSLIVTATKTTKIFSRCDQKVWGEIPVTGNVALAGYPMKIVVSGSNTTDGSSFINAYTF